MRSESEAGLKSGGVEDKRMTFRGVSTVFLATALLGLVVPPMQDKLVADEVVAGPRAVLWGESEAARGAGKLLDAAGQWWLAQLGSIEEPMGPVSVPGPTAPPGPRSPSAPAQPPEAPAETRPTEPAAVRVQEVKPSEYWLPDRTGTLQPVINIPYEVFEEVYRRQFQTTDNPPGFVLTGFKLSGKVEGQVATLEAEVDVKVSQPGWHAIPLGLDRAALLPEWYANQGSPPHFVVFQPSRGYVLWLRAESEGEYRFRFPLAAPVDRSGAESELRLLTPQASSAQCQLRIIGRGLEIRPGEGMELAELTEAEDATRVSALGVSGQLGRAGQFVLRWRESAPGISRGQRRVLECTGRIVVRVSEQQVLSEAEITVRPLSGPLSEFEVLLPNHVELIVGESASGYSLQSLGPREFVGTETVQAIRISFKEPVTNSATIRLTWVQTGPQAGEQYELAGLTVPDAVQHFGHIVVVNPPEWFCLWGEMRNVRRIEPAALPEALRKLENVGGAFEYSLGPTSLTMRLIRRASFVVVNPDYELRLSVDQARLVSTFRVFVRGAATRGIELELEGWTLEELLPPAIFAVDAPPVVREGKMLLTFAQPVAGEVTMQIVAVRKLPAQTGGFSIPLIRCRADLHGGGYLRVVPSENVEILPDLAASRGLLREAESAVAAAGGAAAGSRSGSIALQFRLESAGEGGVVFAGERFVHAQKIAVSSEVQIAALSPSLLVEQRLVFEVAYQPTEFLTVLLPRALATASDCEFHLDGEVVSPVQVGGPSADGGGSSPVRRRIVLRQPRLGRFELLIRYSAELPYLVPRASTMVRIPLAVPSEGTLKHHRVSLSLEEGMRVQPRQAVGLTPMDHWGWLEGPEVALQTEGPLTELALALYRANGTPPVVERAFFQTWLGSTSRQDRAIYRLLTYQRELEIVLPEGADAEQCWVAIAVGNPGNLQPCDVQVTPAGTLRLRLPDRPRGQPCFLELVYRLPLAQGLSGAHRIDFPRLGEALWVRQAWLQVVLPKTEHLILNPKHWIPDHQFRWIGSFWGRVPNYSEADLESWVGALQTVPIPETATRYVFSSHDRVESAEIWVASRATVILVASLVALMGGLALLYVPALRSPTVLWPVAVSALAGVAIWPEQAALCAQAGLLGIILAVCAAVLRRLVGQEAKGTGALPPRRRVGESQFTVTERWLPGVSSETSGETAGPVPAGTASLTS